jgi:guanine deaminase
MSEDPKRWIRQTIALATENVVRNGGGPFAALVIREGRLLATGANSVVADNDPTAHAEIVAMRAACKHLHSFQLDGCELYSNCEPCPMCLGAIYWARPRAIYFASSRIEAARYGFDDDLIYTQISLPPEVRKIPGYRVIVEESEAPFRAWAQRTNKKEY